MASTEATWSEACVCGVQLNNERTKATGRHFLRFIGIFKTSSIRFFIKVSLLHLVIFRYTFSECRCTFSS